jgi:hypothetical protein
MQRAAAEAIGRRAVSLIPSSHEADSRSLGFALRWVSRIFAARKGDTRARYIREMVGGRDGWEIVGSSRKTRVAYNYDNIACRCGWFACTAAGAVKRLRLKQDAEDKGRGVCAAGSWAQVFTTVTSILPTPLLPL